MTVLIAYGTAEGQTARVAEYLAGAIRDHGVDAHAVDVRDWRENAAAGGNDPLIVAQSPICPLPTYAPTFSG